VGFAVIVLLALAGVSAPTAAAGATVTAATGPGDLDKPSKDPKPCHGPNCPTDPATPTPTDTPAEPQSSGSVTPPATSPGNGSPLPPGQQVLSGAPGGPPLRPGAPGQPGGGAGLVADPATDGDTGATPRPAAATSPAGTTLPLWPILWGGTALIALVTGGLLVALRDRRIRPDRGRQEPEQGVASPTGPIRIEWIEPPG
jgi:hypothetical protein